MKAILEDLEKRSVEAKAVIVADKEGLLQLLSYDADGLISFISEKVRTMNINEQLEGRMIRPIVSLSTTT